MFLEKINKTELKILEFIVQKCVSEKVISSNLNQSLSWVSECIHHLAEINFIYVKRKGISKYVSINNNNLGRSLERLIIENELLNLDTLLPNSGLLILPLLLTPGSNINEITEKTQLTKRTIYYKIKEWKSIGIIDLKKYPQKIVFNNSKNNLIKFFIEYCRNRNQKFLDERCPNSTIVWEWRDEFIFTSDNKVISNDFITAGSTRLNELINDIISLSSYYYFNTKEKTISLEEAFIQTIRLDPMNPRPFRLLKNQIKDKNINENDIFEFARKYGVFRRVKGKL